MIQRNNTETKQKISKYLFVLMRTMIFVLIIGGVVYWSYNFYYAFFVELAPHQAGLYLKEVEKLTIDDPLCGIDMPFQLDYINTSAELKTVNAVRSHFSLINYSPVEISLSENGRVIYEHVEEKPYGFWLRLQAKTVSMNIPDNLQRYRVGFCGSGEVYDPANRVVYADSVNTLYIDLKLSAAQPEMEIFLTDVWGVGKYNDSGTSFEYFPITGNPNLLLTVRLLYPNETQSNLFSTELEILDPGENPIINPGVSLKNQNSRLQKPADIVSIVGNAFTLEKPFGYLEIDGGEFKIGHAVDKAIIKAPEDKYIELVSDLSIPVRDYEYAITGTAIQLNIDDENYILSYWQSLAPELQNAYISLVGVITVSILGFLFDKWGRLVNSFKSFLFSPLLPKPVLPSPLKSGMTILYLKSGKRIAGILIRTEGFFQKQYVLLEAREWNGEFWGSQINGEVKVSSDSIEMRFEN
ncbi:hypothetical protein MASR2M66_29570 [Chloroflexota bacterium]